jgi:hypothetical protein
MQSGGQITHGHSLVGKVSPTYKTWLRMKERCYNPHKDKYKYYGGRGIKVCARWSKFENFLADMGEKPAGLTLDRVDNDGDYKPSNCRWATLKEQARNKRNNHFLTFRGETRTLTEWARTLKIPQPTLSRRLIDGWRVEDALTKDPSKWFTKNR